MIILIDNGHGRDTRGKCSPDRRLLEWQYTREIASEVTARLRAGGVDARRIVEEAADVSLSERCRRVNAICRAEGAGNVALVSIHVNAAGSDGRWHQASGWEAWTSPGRTEADALAECLYGAARLTLMPLLPSARLLRTDFSDGDSDKEARFAILAGSRCRAVLTENLFQDNREDVDFLLSPSGRDAIAALHVKGITDYIATLR